jgi:LPXTG-site transpeptidase (sortase) family protein
MFGRTVVIALCLVAFVSPDATGGLSVPAPVAAVPALGPGVLSQVAAPASPATPATAPNPNPSRLLIPKIGVNAKIEARGLDSNRNMLTPSDFNDVAWYNLGPTPGEHGNALMNGHVNWWTGSAVFTRLSELRPGDKIVIVRRDGTRLTFKVTGRQIVLANARVASLFAPSSVARLTLITCTGAWDSRIMSDTHRLLVSAVLA